MARAYTQIFCSIWDDDDFCALSSDAQRTYFMLTSQDDIGAAGVLAVRLRRWSRTLPMDDRGRLEPSIKELVAAGYVYEDDDTEELLVRSFVKWDGGYKHSKRVLAVVASAEAIKSQSLRNVMASELDKLGVRHAVRVATPTQPIANPMGFDSQPIGNPEWQSNANQQAIDSGRVVVTYQPTEPQAVILDPETRNLEPGASADNGAHLAPVPFCEKHLGGTDEACRECGTARTTFPARQAAYLAAEARARERRLRARQDAVIDQDRRAPIENPTGRQALAESRAALSARKAARPAEVTPEIAAFLDQLSERESRIAGQDDDAEQPQPGADE